MKKIFTLFNQSKHHLLTMAFLMIILAGCKKDIVDDTDTNVPVNYLDQVSYSAQYNVLVFKNVNTLQQIIAQNAATSGSTVAALNARFPGFVSMRNIYTQFDKKEADLIEKLDDSALSSTNVDWTKYLKMSDIGKNYSDMILVKRFADNQEYYYEMNVREKHYADFANPEGLFVINDTIYQVTANRVKLITDGDYVKIRMLSYVNTSSPADHIMVIPAVQFMLGYYTTPTGTGGRGCTLVWDKPAETASGSGVDERRIGINVHFEQHPYYGVMNKTSCYTVLEYAKHKQLIISRGKLSHIWVDASKYTSELTGQFSAAYSPRDIAGPYGSGYTAGVTNPFYSRPCTLHSPFYHYTDYSDQADPCYTMTHGDYKMLVKFAAFSASANVTW
jgi:hypothetical protein